MRDLIFLLSAGMLYAVSFIIMGLAESALKAAGKVKNPVVETGSFKLILKQDRFE